MCLNLPKISSNVIATFKVDGYYDNSWPCGSYINPWMPSSPEYPDYPCTNAVNEQPWGEVYPDSSQNFNP